MKTTLTRALLAFVFCTGFSATPLSVAGQLSVHFSDETFLSRQEVRWLNEQGVIAKMKTFVARNLVMDETLEIRFYNGSETFYDAGAHSILVPVSILRRLLDNVASKYPQQPEVQRLVYAVSVEHLLWYQLGRALINHFDIPIRGRESYSLDSFVAVMLLNLNDLRSDFLLDGMEAYLLSVGSGTVLADGLTGSESEQDEIRYRLLVCLVLGLDYAHRRERVSELAWDEEELLKCQERYWQALAAWHRNLEPHLNATNQLSGWLARKQAISVTEESDPAESHDTP